MCTPVNTSALGSGSANVAALKPPQGGQDSGVQPIANPFQNLK